ncbi:MAG: type VII toxin-antitoxin system HepT family RNase toxin [Candidatus Helarchaeota archaeon]
MPLDRIKIQGKIDIIDRNLEFLAEYDQINETNFLNSYRDIQAVKYSLFETIESCIDIASHIIAAKSYERAESYSEMFKILGNKKIINSELAEKLSKMAKFRNILVHSYAKVDNLRIWNYLKKELKEIKLFVRTILKYLRQEEIQ